MVSLLLVSWLLLRSLFLFFWLIFFLFVSVVLLWDYDNKRRFPCNSGFFFFQKGCYYSWYRQRVSGNSRDVLLVSPPPPQALFQTTLGLSFSLVLSSVFHFNIFFFINPFRDIIIVSFLWLCLCCSFPFFVSASFLPTNFLPSPSPIHLAFILSRFALLFFLFARYCFQAWRFLLSFSCWFLFGFLLTVVVTFFSSPGVVFFVSLSVVCGCANVAKVVLVSAQGSFFKTNLGLSFSLIFVSFLSSMSTFQGVFFMRPTFELTLSFCFSGVLFLAPLHSSFLLRSFQPVSCHPLLQSTLLSFLVFSLFYSSSLHAIFASGLALPSCLFLAGFCLVCFWLLSSPFFLTGVCLLSFSFWCVWWSDSGEGWLCVIVLTYAKGGFPCGKWRTKRTSQITQAGLLTGRGGALN